MPQADTPYLIRTYALRSHDQDEKRSMRHDARRSTQNARGGYSEETQIRAGDNGGSARVLRPVPVTRRHTIDGITLRSTFDPAPAGLACWSP
jgi:hypothetical protein